MCLTQEVRREENVNVVVEYSDMKSETDLKSELTKAISNQRQNQNQGKQAKYFHR
jgi:hypothetical protein